MARREDRHVGRRENVWFSTAEHDALLVATKASGAESKSAFVRAAVAHYISALDLRGETKPQRKEK